MRRPRCWRWRWAKFPDRAQRARRGAAGTGRPRAPLEIGLPALPCRGGAGLADRLLGPLGWAVQAEPVPLDPELPEWGDSAYLSVRLTGRLRLADALSQLYVLLPVLDDAKHYWVADAEVDKLIRAGSGWLAGHPERDLITRRYLAHRNRLVLWPPGRRWPCRATTRTS